MAATGGPYSICTCTVQSALLPSAIVRAQEAQLNEVLASSNLDPSAVTMITRKLEVSTGLIGESEEISYNGNMAHTHTHTLYIYV